MPMSVSAPWSMTAGRCDRPSCSMWHSLQLLMFAWNEVGWRLSSEVLLAWQTMQLLAVTPATGVWQALQLFSRDACAAESGPGLAAACQVFTLVSKDFTSG